MKPGPAPDPIPITPEVRKVSKEYGLTTRQARFCLAYVVNGGNALQSTKDAGYNGGESGIGTRSVELGQNRAVKSAIDGIIGENLAKYTSQDILRDLQDIKIDALENKNHGAAVKCVELHGKHIGMWATASLDLGDVELVIRRGSPTLPPIEGELAEDQALPGPENTDNP